MKMKNKRCLLLDSLLTSELNDDPQPGLFLPYLYNTF